MADFSLVPVDYQPDFDDFSLVPVEHDPFGDDGLMERVPAQLAQAQQTPTQSQPAQFQQTQPQIQPQPVPSAQPTRPIPTGSTVEGDSPFVRFFNQLAAPELAQSQGVTDLVRNNPTAAKMEGAVGLGSLLFPPLAIAGAEGLGLFGAGAAGAVATDGLAGSTISRAGRAAGAALPDKPSPGQKPRYPKE
jgi:hypothetical protein